MSPSVPLSIWDVCLLVSRLLSTCSAHNQYGRAGVLVLSLFIFLLPFFLSPNCTVRISGCPSAVCLSVPSLFPYPFYNCYSWMVRLQFLSRCVGRLSDYLYWLFICLSVPIILFSVRFLFALVNKGTEINIPVASCFGFFFSGCQSSCI